MPSTLRAFATALALPALLACSAASTEPVASKGAPQGVAVEVQPPSATLGVGGNVQFAAVVTGTVNTDVTWATAGDRTFTQMAEAWDADDMDALLLLADMGATLVVIFNGLRLLKPRVE